MFQASTDIPTSIKQEIIQLKCLLNRCTEEKQFLKQEMKSVINWYKHQYNKVKGKFGALATGGEIALLIKEGMYYEMVICKLNNLFQDYIGDASIEIMLTESVLTDDYQKMQEMLKYVASTEELSVEDIESDTESDEDEDAEDMVS